MERCGTCVIDLRRATGIDSSAVLAFRKVAQIAEANGFELVLTDVPEPVMTQLELRRRGRRRTGSFGSSPTSIAGCRCARTALLGDAAVAASDDRGDVLGGMPAGAERVPLARVAARRERC